MNIILRFMAFLATTFLAVCLGLMEYWLVATLGLPFLHAVHDLGNLPLEWQLFWGLDVFLLVTVVVLVGAGAIGIFGFGFLGLFEGKDQPTVRSF